MAELVLYERARQSLIEAKSVDEVKGIRDRAVAAQVYAKQALDPELINLATEIRLRAERRAGEILREMRINGERVRGGGELRGKGSQPATLADIGINKMQSHRWQKLSEMAQEDFEKRLASAQKLAVKSVESSPEERTAEKKERRAQHEADLATKIRALPSKKFGLILADPEWKFVVRNEDTGNDRAAANHYATSAIEDIKARDVPSISADDCCLALWATAPMLALALEVMAHWGFEYKSHCIWLKSGVGTGYWFRSVHELLLIGTRGHVPCPAPGTQWESAWDAETGAHSEKPPEAYKMLEAYFPTLPKIELNARKKREGWEVWGAEAPIDLDDVE